MLTAYLNILVIFILIFIGYLLTYRQWFNNQVADAFSKLVLNIALPCSMFLNITKQFSKAEFIQLFSGMLIPLLSMSITLLISYFYGKITKVKTGRLGSFTTMATCSNTIFIGLPINLAIFGEISVPFVLLYYIVNTTFFWTVGVFLIAKDNPQAETAQISFHPLTALKKIFSPALLGFIIGLLWILTEVPVPSMLQTLSSYLGQLTTPLSMFVIGIIIYYTGIRNLKLNKDIVGVLIGRYLLSPLIVWLISHFVKVPELMLNVFIIQSAMPIQNSVPILVRNYDADVDFAASSLAYSILLYLIYIPLLLLIIL
ncbi:putative permease [Enterococcus sp. PF1-24]|uniref:AEC family transporter n=1 Tax=unclassified Enterococcus TaxID=2608891 RepID=UPI00247317AA|nr:MULTISPECIES: AEC family transporter [unclassified Enterococcus]MDH6365126.1 putative permease [Enterococcus sp. PFB1-1]MDH6402227.1 putative permease [Enterococcus sp. PF1-24]